MTSNVLVVDDDSLQRRLLRRHLEELGLPVVEYESADGVLGATLDRAGCVCLDLGLGAADGLDVLEHLRVRAPDLPIVVVTADRDVARAVRAMRSGAYDYLTKPVDPQRLGVVVRNALERRELSASVKRLRAGVDESAVLATIVTRNARMQDLARQVERIAGSEVPVCVFGESGTGKELFARALHLAGRHSAGPFVAVNCAAIPQTLQESELFGHERGAFTGAQSAHRGRFEQAEGGTLFLDELGDMSLATQAALLRVLEERVVRRIGGSTDIRVNVRIVAATHRDLEAEVAAGRFREDLYYRLVVYPMTLPPLRERKDDLPLLASHFLRRYREDVGRDVTRISPVAMEALSRHAWPGNLRELGNVVYRAMLSCDGDEIGVAHLPPALQALVLPALPALAPPARNGAVLPLREVEQRAIDAALVAAGGNVGEAARMLGVGRATLYRRVAASAPR